jgi:hypothetical protein
MRVAYYLMFVLGVKILRMGKGGIDILIGIAFWQAVTLPGLLEDRLDLCCLRSNARILAA